MNEKIYSLSDLIKEFGEIPYCQCDSNNGKGCGQKVNIKPNKFGSYAIYKRKGYPKFIRGHSGKGKNNPFLNHKHTEMTKEQNRNAHKGISPSQQTRDKQSKSTRGIPKSEDHKRKISTALKNKPKSESHKHNLSIIKIEQWKNPEIRNNHLKSFHTEKWIEAHSGKHNINYGKQTPHGKKIFPHQTPLQGLVLMHRWDRKVAQYYDENKIQYLYEPKIFDLILNGKQTSYTPDFYLPEINEFIEIKGYWRDDAWVKFEQFKLQYPNIKIKVLFGKDLKELGIDLKFTKEEKEILKIYKNKI